MKIIFGTSSFKLVRNKPSELGLPFDLDKDMTIEKRQRYFHLFWIPFFSVGQIWIFKKEGDRSKYELPAELNKKLIELHPHHKTPWYTFSLLLLLLAALFSFVGFAIYSDVSDSMAHEESLKDDAMKQNTNVTQAFSDTYYQLYDEEGSSVMLRAIKSDRNTITAEVSAKKMSEGMDFPASIMSPFQPDSLGNSHFDTVTVNKKSLLAAFNADWQGEVQRINIGKYKKLRFLASYNLNIPIFAFTRFQKKGDHYIFTVKNLHKTATILKIEQDGHSNDMQLQSLKLPMTLNNGDTLQLMLRVLEENPWYNGLLVYKNNRNTEQTMRFELYENNMVVYNHDFSEE